MELQEREVGGDSQATPDSSAGFPVQVVDAEEDDDLLGVLDHRVTVWNRVCTDGGRQKMTNIRSCEAVIVLGADTAGAKGFLC